MSSVVVGTTAVRHPARYTQTLSCGRSLSSDLFPGVPRKDQKAVRSGAGRVGSQQERLNRAKSQGESLWGPRGA